VVFGGVNRIVRPSSERFIFSELNNTIQELMENGDVHQYVKTGQNATAVFDM
jgi:hypothetical protein